MSGMSVPEKLAIDKYQLDEDQPHIVVDNRICQSTCKERPCLFVCPAELYSEQDGKIIVEWAGCLECGTCQVVCEPKALSWVYPRGGFGIIYRYG